MHGQPGRAYEGGETVEIGGAAGDGERSVSSRGIFWMDNNGNYGPKEKGTMLQKRDRDTH